MKYILKLLFQACGMMYMYQRSNVGVVPKMKHDVLRNGYMLANPFAAGEELWQFTQSLEECDLVG